MVARRVTLLLILGVCACGRTGFDGPDGTGPVETSTPAPTATPSPAATAVIPASVPAELVHQAPQRGWGSPLWRENLPKLAADASWFYAVHTHLNANADSRYVAILRKRRDAAPGTPWELAATIARPAFQHAGIAVDGMERLHVVFQCMRDGGGIIDIGLSQDRCWLDFNAGSEGRAWHAVVEERVGDTLRFDLATGAATEAVDGDEGEFGLGVSGNRVWWSVLDETDRRVVRAWDGPASFTTVTHPAPQGSRLALDPLFAPSPSGGGESLLLLGEYDRATEDYVSTSALQSMQNSFAEVVRRDASGARPLDVAFEPDGTVVVLADRDGAEEILRFDGGVSAAPTVLPVDVSDSAQLQISSAGVWYLLEQDHDTTGPAIRLLASADRGVTWSVHDVPVTGVAPADVALDGFALLEPHSAPGAYDPDRISFLLTGKNMQGSYGATYFGTFPLK